jgi:hypothetical protein
MSYTRRAVIRDAAVLSLAGVGGFSPLLSGCHRSRFADGIRIFFEGAWLFCAHPENNKEMLAVTVDPSVCMPPQPSPSSADDMTHIFPYGVWDERWDPKVGWDREDGRLKLDCNTNAPNGSMPCLHRVAIFGNWQAGPDDVDGLFGQIVSWTQFTYLQNPGTIYQSSWAKAGVRAISLPMPTKIIPGGFRTAASINDGTGNVNLGATTGDQGVATTHIFDYPGAHSMAFVPLTGEALEMGHGTGHHSDFHFHTVPNSPQPPPAHAVMMFQCLVGLLTQSSTSNPPAIGLKDPKPCAPIQRGIRVPDSVKSEELEMLKVKDSRQPQDPMGYECGFTTNLATCGSGGLGVGGGH